MSTSAKSIETPNCSRLKTETPTSHFAPRRSFSVDICTVLVVCSNFCVSNYFTYENSLNCTAHTRNRFRSDVAPNIKFHCGRLHKRVKEAPPPPPNKVGCVQF